MKPVIKWSGSKRSQAGELIKRVPLFDTYYEPFLGGGSMMQAVSPPKGICSDICEPLMALWETIQENPHELAEEYRIRWKQLQEGGGEVYYDIRNRFNAEHSPYDFLFLTRTCTNGLIRFNGKGEFNNSLHHGRPGIHPNRMEKIICEWSDRIQTITFRCGDYRETTKTAVRGDFVYLDPPYFHTRGMYFGGIDFNGFCEYLSDLNDRGVNFMLSYDGVRGKEDFRADIPGELYKKHELIPSGISSFSRIVKKEKVMVRESIYMNY